MNPNPHYGDDDPSAATIADADDAVQLVIRQLFPVPIGQLVATAAYHEWMSDDAHPTRTAETIHAIRRHVHADWGDLDDEDRDANDRALIYGDRLLSAYTIDDRRVWVITEADRSVTTILFPEDY